MKTILLLFSSVVIGAVIVGVYIDYTTPTPTFEKRATIKCYSGNTLTYEGKSGGPIRNVKSNSYEFRELGTNNSMEISGNCIIKYDN